ncbi:YcxB family protein [Kaistella sp. G5-32]|uniref:YcxB family protein n=1 Tax=Kaistella gelatinilytica TaxID=2787636 RepID=A0ABS0F8E7_9FLAO|nr:YcxB family protein [Kaistella gelatinilytica]MBF8455977.1 YcxB family protein [Kaistella gelatinilytica]
MIIDYSLTKEDFLHYLLYAESKNKKLPKVIRQTYIWISVAFVIFVLNIYNRNKFALWFFIPAFLIFVISFPFLLKWLTKSHYKKFIEENFKERIGLNTSIEFHSDQLIIKNSVGESRFNFDSFVEINEVANYYFLKLKTLESVIIPKSSIQNIVDFKIFVEKLKAKYDIAENVELDWKFSIT